jgi:hypothetical protein
VAQAVDRWVLAILGAPGRLAIEFALREPSAMQGATVSKLT